MEKFVRRQNIEHYLQLLATTTDDGERQMVMILLAEERKKQKDAGDKGETIQSINTDRRLVSATHSDGATPNDCGGQCGAKPVLQSRLPLPTL